MSRILSWDEEIPNLHAVNRPAPLPTLPTRTGVAIIPLLAAQHSSNTNVGETNDPPDLETALWNLISMITFWFSEFLKGLPLSAQIRNSLSNPAASFRMLFQGIANRIRNNPPTPVLNPFSRNSIYNYYSPYGISVIYNYYYHQISTRNAKNTADFQSA